MNIPQFLRALRKDRGWTQEEAAKRLGVSRTHLNEVENEKKDFSLAFLTKAADVYGMTLTDLMAYEREVSVSKAAMLNAYQTSALRFWRINEQIELMQNQLSILTEILDLLRKLEGKLEKTTDKESKDGLNNKKGESRHQRRMKI
jgi:putative transcriptional regulator